MGRTSGRLRAGGHPGMSICLYCGRPEPRDPYGYAPPEPVKVIKVIRRDADNKPISFREYFLSSETAGTAGQKRVRLGEPAASGDVPA